MLLLLLAVFVAALAFEFVNGFHDTANSVAAVVGTRALGPSHAIGLAAVMNLLGALAGTAVATTVGKGLVDAGAITNSAVLCALVGATLWNIITWSLGLPSSSSHALFGGLVGAAVASGGWGTVIWAVPIEGKPWFAGGGLLYKVILPMMVSPLLGFLLGAVLMAGLYFLFRNRRPWPVNARFARLQILSSAAMGFSHGSNDAQKTMGIITLGLFSATTAGTLDHLPASLHFLRTPAFEVALWVKLVCAVTMAAGTATGGRRIIKTLGRKVSRLQPVNGFASDLTSATIILIAAKMGMPVSTTHIASSSIMGVGFARRSKGMRWDVVESILWAWFLTLPASGLAGYLLMTIMGGK